MIQYAYEEPKDLEAWADAYDNVSGRKRTTNTVQSHAKQKIEIFKDKQVGGNHYQLPIQPIDYIVKNNLGFREGNVIKYVTRHKEKNGKEDIKKAIHYLEMILEDYNDN